MTLSWVVPLPISSYLYIFVKSDWINGLDKSNSAISFQVFALSKRIFSSKDPIATKYDVFEYYTDLIPKA